MIAFENGEMNFILVPFENGEMDLNLAFENEEGNMQRIMQYVSVRIFLAKHHN